MIRQKVPLESRQMFILCHYFLLSLELWPNYTCYFFQISFEFCPTSEISGCSVHDNSKIYTDAWGKEFNWYDPEDGWNEERRKSVLEESELNRLQSKRMPAYTQNGYAKMKIPSHLYELINEAKNESKNVTESCDKVRQNCARVKEDGTIGT